MTRRPPRRAHPQSDPEKQADPAQTTRTARVVRHFRLKVADKRTKDDLNREKWGDELNKQWLEKAIETSVSCR